MGYPGQGVPVEDLWLSPKLSPGMGPPPAGSSSSPEHLPGRGAPPRCFCLPRKQPHLPRWFQLASPPLCLKINKKSGDARLLGKAEWHPQNVCPARGEGGWRGCPCLPARHCSGTGSRAAGGRRAVPVPRSAARHSHAWDGLGCAGQPGSSRGAAGWRALPRDLVFGVWAAVVVFFVPRFPGR